MGSDLAEQFAVARRVLEEADEALGMYLSRLMRSGTAVRWRTRPQPCVPMADTGCGRRSCNRPR